MGHSNRSLSIFIDLLNTYGIKAVIDVRRFPSSRKYPWFTRENLSKALEKVGIRYIWLGDLLGGYRKGGYREYMKTIEYKKGIEKLIKYIYEVGGYTAILCSEKLWFRCHRRFISDTLVEKGFEVIHIIDFNKVYRHKGATP